MGDDDEGRGDAGGCQQAVAVLHESGGPLRRWQMAAVAARSHGKERYGARAVAMEQPDVRSVIIHRVGEACRSVERVLVGSLGVQRSGARAASRAASPTSGASK